MNKQELVNMVKEVKNYGIDLPIIFRYVLSNAYYYTKASDMSKGFRKYICINLEDYIKEIKTMKKKLKDVTLEDMMKQCNKYARCNKCPLHDLCYSLCAISPNMFPKDVLDKEIDL